MKFLSRKFIFAVLITLLSFILAIQGKIDADKWLAFVGVVGATYIVGNVMSKNEKV